MPDGRFPPPWTVEEYRGISYIVRDANRFAVAHIYFASDSRHTRHLMTKDEARIIAATIAKLPEIVMRATAEGNDHPTTEARSGRRNEALRLGDKGAGAVSGDDQLASDSTNRFDIGLAVRSYGNSV